MLQLILISIQKYFRLNFPQKVLYEYQNSPDITKRNPDNTVKWYLPIEIPYLPIGKNRIEVLIIF